MIFRINMYVLGRERRLAAQRRLRQLALLAVAVGVNAVAVGLFVFAVVLCSHDLSVLRERLGTEEERLARFATEEGATISEEQLDLLRMRADRVKWSDVLRIVPEVVPESIWFPRIQLAESYVSDSPVRVPGLKLSGRLTVVREDEEGITTIMKFVHALGQDPRDQKHFLEPKLTDSTWASEDDEEYLEFDLFCPVNGPMAVEAGLVAAPEGDGQFIEVEIAGDDGYDLVASPIEENDGISS